MTEPGLTAPFLRQGRETQRNTRRTKEDTEKAQRAQRRRRYAAAYALWKPRYIATTPCVDTEDAPTQLGAETGIMK